MYFTLEELNHLYFTADQHFMHENIVKYRPNFSSAKQMSEVIINNYNKYIDKNGICINLGDFSLTNNNNIYNLQTIRSKLNGKIELILGNHDLFPITTYLEIIGIDNIHKFEKVLLPYKFKYNNFLQFDMNEICPFVFCHDFVCATVLSNCICLCGHVHSLFKTLYEPKTNVLIINVGLDVWNYEPVSFSSIVTTILDSNFNLK